MSVVRVRPAIRRVSCIALVPGRIDVDTVVLRVDSPLILASGGADSRREADLLRHSECRRVGRDLDVALVHEDVSAVDDERHQGQEQRQGKRYEDERLAALAPSSLVMFEQVLPSEWAYSASKDA